MITDFNLFRTDISVLFFKNVLLLNTFAFICFRLTLGAQSCQSAHQATLPLTLCAPKRRTPKHAPWAVQILAGFRPIHIVHEASALHDVGESPPQVFLLLQTQALPTDRAGRAHAHKYVHHDVRALCSRSTFAAMGEPAMHITVSFLIYVILHLRLFIY